MMRMTRVDVSYNITFLSRFAKKPIKEAWDALVIVVQYMYHSRSIAVLTYGGKFIRTPHLPTATPPLNPSIFEALDGFYVVSDASWKTNHTYCGALVFYNNGVVDWVCQLVKVKLSSTEAEIGAGVIGGKRGMYVRGMIGEVSPFKKAPAVHVVHTSATPALSENVGVAKKKL